MMATKKIMIWVGLIIGALVVLLGLVVGGYWLNYELNKKEAIVPEKNAQGIYELTLQMGESIEGLYSENPGLIRGGASGMGPGFHYPNLSFKEMANLKLRILE